MDKETRNAIERATQGARKVLADDFAEQLESTFDILRSGDVASGGGPHLNASEHVQRGKIVAAIQHKRAAGMSAAEAVADYVRDAAFTALNRFVALKMLEARQLTQECITRGEQSGGYKEFCGLAPGVALLPGGEGYRLYIECLFDELSTEIKVLFDRRDVASVLWPRRQTFEELLALLNAEELAGVWGEDETIGWVYQYFNSAQDRERARYDDKGKPKAPQNSRDLAVRNQFFTPQYVVQFLTDNTLGRIWYEMRRGDTRLAARCDYLVHRPDETYPPRPKKDPRDLRILDPACGSGHFLLYAFDLLLAIYEEAWADPASPASDITSRTLREDHLDLSALRSALPELVLRHNLHGVDIDPRCAQIAQLALWMRAQRAYNESGIARADRPRIRRANIIVAEPMPGDRALVEEFATRLEPPFLRELFKTIDSELRLAGELALLLRIEADLSEAIGKARKQFVARERELTKGYLPGFEPAKKQGELDLSGIDDRHFFEQAEALIGDALRRFAVGAAGSAGTRRRLFAEDAVQGLGLVEMAEKRFDVVLMNPPFGEPTLRAANYLKAHGSDGWKDIYAGFFEVALRLSGSEGFVGTISSSQYFHTRQLRTLRETLMLHHRLLTLVDLGAGVLDGATVSTALAILGSGRNDSALYYLDLFAEVDKAEVLLTGASGGSFSALSLDDLTAIPGRPFCLHATPRVLSQWHRDTTLDPHTASVVTGNHTFDDERFLRLRYEVDMTAVGSGWVTFEKGGEYQPFSSPPPLLLQWKQDGAELRALNERRHGSQAQVMQSSRFWYKPGLCYTHVSSVGFSPRVLRAQTIFSSESIGIFVCCEPDGEFVEGKMLALLGFLASTAAQELIWVFGRYRKIENRAVSGLPISFDRLSSVEQVLADSAYDAVLLVTELASFDETSPVFCMPDALRDGNLEARRRTEIASSLKALYGRIDAYVEHALGLEPTDLHAPRRAELVRNFAFRRTAGTREACAADLVMWATGVAFGRWSAMPMESFASLSPQDLFSPLPTNPVAVSAKGSLHAVLVHDEGHRDDIAATVSRILSELGAAMIDAVCVVLGATTIAEWLRHAFFDFHIARYSDFKRRAPVYWQLATPSASYSVWLYIHAYSKDTLYHVQNDYVAPKLAHEERRLESLRAEAGASPTSAQRRQLAAQEVFVEELRAMLEEVKRVAPLWNPDLADGVVINFSPLWRLVPQNKPWQKELRAKWDALCGGEYEWAHLAMHLWPERVVPKCAADRSLAIAHGLEQVFWVEDADGTWKALDKPLRPVEELIRERSSAAVKAALDSLLRADVAAANGRARTRQRRSK